MPMGMNLCVLVPKDCEGGLNHILIRNEERFLQNFIVILNRYFLDISSIFPRYFLDYVIFSDVSKLKSPSTQCCVTRRKRLITSMCI